MRRFIRFLLYSAGFAALAVVLLLALPKPPCPALQSGDLIFQTSRSDQSKAIFAATWSLYTHVGIVDARPEGSEVVHAAGTVHRTPLGEWVDGGIGRFYTVYRVQGLTSEQGRAVVAHADAYLGRPYDRYFLDGDDQLYCSELAHRAYARSNIPLGTSQRAGELHLDNAPVRALIAARWQSHPLCRTPGIGYAECYKRILDQTMVTPASVAMDEKLIKVCSTYP